jgi:hypothetical protein
METLIEEDLHWWLWSQSTRRVGLEHPAGGLRSFRQQRASRLTGSFIFTTISVAGTACAGYGNCSKN